MREGDPIREIFDQAAAGNYEVAVIGARRTARFGPLLLFGTHLRSDQGRTGRGAGCD